MKTNEVRVGNRVLFAEDGTEFIVTDIVGSGFNVKNEEENTWIEADQFEGIPLTVEWLLKFGFKIKDNDGRFILLDGDVDILFDDDLDCWTCDGVCFSVNCLNSVHQLQNLYFVLTGEELTIKENGTTNPL
jgi:hypothetical protein